MSGTELVLLVTIVLMLLILMVLAAAETALNRISRVKAQALADSNDSRSARALVKLVEHPERFINPLLVTVTVLQMWPDRGSSASLADRLGRGRARRARHLRPQRRRVLRGRRVDAEDVGRAAHRAGRAGDGALHQPARVVPAAAASISRGLIWLTNVLLPGQGPQAGAVRQRAGAARHRRGRRRRRRDRARRARADREHHRVRRHGRPRGDGAATRHGDHPPRGHGHAGARPGDRAGLQPAAGRRRRRTTTWSASPTRRT